MMARSAITAQKVVATGLELTTEAANSDGNMFTNTGRQILFVDNGSESDVKVTIQTGAKYGGLDVSDREVTVTAGEARYIGKLSPAVYNQTSGDDEGKVYVDYDAVTTVTVVVLEY